MTEYELALFVAMLQVLPGLLKGHHYGVYELARELSQRFGAPLPEIMTPLSEALQTLTKEGRITYDRPHNWVLPAI